MKKFFKLERTRHECEDRDCSRYYHIHGKLAYILMVNAGMFANPFGDGTKRTRRKLRRYLCCDSYFRRYRYAADWSSFKSASAQASGMGLNAFFVYSVVVGMGFSYANALVMVLVDGLVFVLLTVTGLRKTIFAAIPKAVKTAIAAGIGLFIAFIGLQNSGIVVNSDATLVDLHSFNIFFNDAVTWEKIMPLLVTILAVIAIAIMSKKKVKGAILVGILGATAVYYALGFTIPGFYEGFASKFNLDVLAPFKDFGTMAVGKVFTEGFNFTSFIEANGVTSFVITFITTMLAFCMVDMFDTLGTIYSACACGNMLTEEGDVPNMDKAMLSDAIATCTGAICGTSTVTTFVESSAGVAEGGRTGLTSIATAAMFLIAMFFAPVA